MKARPRHAGALGGRDHHAIAQVARPQRRTLSADEQQLGLAAIGDERHELPREPATNRNRTPAMPGLRGAELSADDRTPDTEPRLVRLQVDVHDAQRDRLRDPQTRRREQLEERPPRDRDLGEETRELLARQEAALVELVGPTAAPPRQEDHGLRTVGE